MSLDDEINFSFELLSLLNGTNESTVISPASIISGLATVFAGAKDETAKQIAQIIGKCKSDQDIFKYYSESIRNFQHNGKNCKNVNVKFCNQLFVSKKINLLPQFCELMDKSFDGKVKEMDFDKAEETSEMINLFVRKRTDGQIRDITSSSDITKNLSVILINAIYFSAKWKDIFRPRKKRTFFSDPPREIDMMHRQVMEDCEWNFVKTENCYILGIPYEQCSWMYIVLPNEIDGLPKIIQSLSLNNFYQWTKRNVNPYIIVSIPVMNISNNFDLKDSCQKLGMKDAFEDYCNLGGMTEKPSKLHKIFHKAIIKTDEYGTEANASTAVYDLLCGGKIERFKANHPFLYFITSNDPSSSDSKLLNILFIGTFC